MITYTWSFPNFETNSENVVKTIHWRYTAVDGEHSASMYGSCAGSDGMNFDAMTKEHCVSCVLENQEQTEEDMQSNFISTNRRTKKPRNNI
jgi:hypothetical protein